MRFGSASPDTVIVLRKVVPVDRGEAAAVRAVGTLAAGLAAALFALNRRAPTIDEGALVLSDRLPMSLTTVLKHHYGHLLLSTQILLATGTAALLVSRLGPAAGLAMSLPLALLGSAHHDLAMPRERVYEQLPDERRR